MEEKNNLWIPAITTTSGALIAGVAGAIIGGLIGAIIKEIFCPICGSLMRFIENNLWKCPKCGYVIHRQK